MKAAQIEKKGYGNTSLRLIRRRMGWRDVDY